VAEEARAAQPAFAARVAGAAAADDALLDLDLDAPASVGEADDFILDLDLDDEPPASREAAPAQAAAAPDAAAAFAEAAHGETVHDSRAAVQQLQDMQVEHERMATEVVAQDEPQASAVEHGLSGEREFSDVQDFGSHTAREVLSAATVDEVSAAPHEAPGASSFEETSAPRGFVEPEVVPAGEATPAAVEAEFTDGSVEGDVAKPPAGGFVETSFEAEAAPVVEHEAAPAAESVSSAPVAEGSSAAHESPLPPAPSTAGYEMGAARVGVAEGARPEQLSPEMIETIARRVVELMSDKVVREIAWEVVPDLAELLIKRKLDEDARKR
jgi:hypothetical protein